MNRKDIASVPTVRHTAMAGLVAASLVGLAIEPPALALARAEQPEWDRRPTLAASLPPRPAHAPGGREFAALTAGLTVAERERALLAELESGNVPDFLRTLVPVEMPARSAGGRSATIWVTPDYLAVGSDEDFLYAPLGRAGAGEIATRTGCVWPTARMVDAIWAAARHVVPSPLPAGPQMASNQYLLRHQRQIDAQRASFPRGELLAGHKKDLVLTHRLQPWPGRVAIYGWHRGPGEPIQPLSTVHGARYVDYSHGLRLVAETILVDGERRSIYDVLADRRLAPLLGDEDATPDARELLRPALPVDVAHEHVASPLASGAGR